MQERTKTLAKELRDVNQERKTTFKDFTDANEK